MMGLEGWRLGLGWERGVGGFRGIRWDMWRTCKVLEIYHGEGKKFKDHEMVLKETAS